MAGTRCSAMRLSRVVKSSGSGPSAPTMKGAAVPATYCFGHVYSYAAIVGRRVAGRDNEFRRVIRIGLTEGAGVAGNARVELAVDRVQYELGHGAMGYVSLRQRRGRRRMGWAQDKVAVLVGWRHGAVGKFLAAHKARRVRGTGGIHGANGRRGRSRRLRVCQRASEKQNDGKGRAGKMHGIALWPLRRSIA